MAKDNLTSALSGLKEIEKKRSPHKSAKKRPAKRGRPKAFDPFYLLCTLLAVLAIGLQLVAIAVYG
ncbi:hypothetical protein IEN85_15985 [Pelagicoccus sp. NFK12]|uniref:Uncharacterized protein n=1 Tax=Pelagicoccus enzymogenes TaxID=2773457 RepID=A0A927FAX6_9BACT|nr:hypothetical protein [Pelagicoccus enzymogenes]MBD5781001.1 hypothetical protein [Pelagicoccus enzymogenes]MDQ8198690.1 hypothetical protein [Pelagicoccus enzymogenes]